MLELVRYEEKTPTTMEDALITINELQTQLAGMAAMMQSMADMIRANNQQIAQMTDAMKRLAMRQPVTRTQAARLNQLVKARAGELADAWGYPDQAGQIATAIRRDVKKALESGAGISFRSMADVPSCQHDVVAGIIKRWDSFGIRLKLMKGEKI